jgi:hypothetical protein
VTAVVTTADGEDRPLMGEREVIQYLKDHFTTNPKKLKNIAKRIIPLSKDYTVRGIIRSLIEHRDPVGYIKKCFVQIEEYNVLIMQFIEQGYHGMIMIQDTVYPVSLDTQEHWLKDRWTMDDEIDIQHRLIDNFMVEHNRTWFHGKIVLFYHFGFSGIPREIRKVPRK